MKMLLTILLLLGTPDKSLYSLYSTDQNLSIQFNLEQPKTVEFDMYDLVGRKVASHQWIDVRDQAFTVELTGAVNKIFIVRLLIDKKYYTDKVYIK